MALSPQTIQTIIDCSASDPDFAKELLADPEAALDARAISLQPDQMTELRELVVAASQPRDEMVEELQARISHSLVGHGEVVSLVLIENFLRSAASEK